MTELENSLPSHCWPFQRPLNGGAPLSIIIVILTMKIIIIIGIIIISINVNIFILT